jgi:hypothetical protein
MGSANPILPLDYFPRDDRRRRWRLFFRIVLVVTVIAAGGWVYFYRAEIEVRALRVYWAHRCATHVTPPGTVFLENDPVKAANLIATDPDFVAYSTASRSSRGSRGAAYCPLEFRKYLSLAIPNPPRTPPGPGQSDSIAFLGERTSPGGNRRLVVIGGFGIYEISPANAPSGSGAGDKLLIDRGMPQTSKILSLPGALGGIAPRQVSPLHALPLPSGDHRVLATLRLSAGVADRSDASHIAFGFTTATAIDVTAMSYPGNARSGDPLLGWPPRGTLDIHLLDNDSLDAKLRKPVAP